MQLLDHLLDMIMFYREQLITSLNKCIYCSHYESITHTRNKCPAVKNIFCEACKEKGHTAKECSNVEALRSKW